jgi:hypothetical protein
VNLTVGPGKYDLRLAFANARGLDTKRNCFDIFINGNKVVEKLDISAQAGGPNKATDLFFKEISPANGIIEVRFKGATYEVEGKTKSGEAFVQALEIVRAERHKKLLSSRAKD